MTLKAITDAYVTIRRTNNTIPDGTFKMAEYRAKRVAPMFKDALCFGKTKSGAPKHPAGFILLRNNERRHPSPTVSCKMIVIFVG